MPTTPTNEEVNQQMLMLPGSLQYRGDEQYINVNNDVISWNGEYATSLITSAENGRSAYNWLLQSADNFDNSKLYDFVMVGANVGQQPVELARYNPYQAEKQVKFTSTNKSVTISATPDGADLTVDFNVSYEDEVGAQVSQIVNERLVETFPVGCIIDAPVVNDGSCIAYKFKPTMDFKLSRKTKARIYHTQNDDSTFGVGIYKRDVVNNVEGFRRIWFSEEKQSNEVSLLTLNANNALSQDTIEEISPLDDLFVVFATRGGFKTLGILMAALPNFSNVLDTVVCGSTGGKSFATAVSNVQFVEDPTITWGGVHNGTFKPYIAFRNDE